LTGKESKSIQVHRLLEKPQRYHCQGTLNAITPTRAILNNLIISHRFQHVRALSLSRDTPLHDAPPRRGKWRSCLRRWRSCTHTRYALVFAWRRRAAPARELAPHHGRVYSPSLPASLAFLSLPPALFSSLSPLPPPYSCRARSSCACSPAPCDTPHATSN